MMTLSTGYTLTIVAQTKKERRKCVTMAEPNRATFERSGATKGECNSQNRGVIRRNDNVVETELFKGPSTSGPSTKGRSELVGVGHKNQESDVGKVCNKTAATKPIDVPVEGKRLPDCRREAGLIESVVDNESADNKSTDKQLVERVQRGDKKAFDLLVIKYQGKVAALVSRFVGDSQEVLDVTQESFIKAYRALKNFRGESAFYTWLYRISINTAKNYLVAKGRRPPGVDIDVQDAEHFNGENSLKDIQSPERQLYRSELEQALNKAIRMLPEDLRVALTLREFDGLSYEDIAEVMDCPVGTVRSRIFRARDAIDKKVAPYLDGYEE